jgi:hypothetical protein
MPSSGQKLDAQFQLDAGAVLNHQATDANLRQSKLSRQLNFAIAAISRN